MTTPTTRTGAPHSTATITAFHDDAYAPTLAELLANPELLVPPAPLVPRLVWPGCLTLYSAPDKGGKSTFIGAAVAAASTGRVFLGDNCKRCDVLIVSLEEPQFLLTQRLKRFESDVQRVRILYRPKRPEVALREAVARYKPGLVVLDTLTRYARGRVKKSGDAAQWAPIMEELVELAREHNCGMLVLHHARKSDGSARDSGDITAVADIVIEQRERHSKGRQDFETRGRWANEDFAVQLNGKEFDLIGDSQGADLRSRLLAFVTENPGLSGSAIAKGAKANRGKTLKELAAMQSDGLIVDRGKPPATAWAVLGEGS